MEIEEAIGLVTSNISPIGEELSVKLEDAYGHILANSITASDNVPSFARSAMDGYAVKSEDVSSASKDSPIRLRVVAQVLAGDSSNISYEDKTAVRIMTGGMIPDGYDAVVKQEDTDLGEGEVCVCSPVGKYMNYCHPGEEVQKGAVVIEKGRRIGMIETGLIASLGIDSVRVKRPLRVSIVSTGSELMAPGYDLPKGCIYGNIRYGPGLYDMVAYHIFVIFTVGRICDFKARTSDSRSYHVSDAPVYTSFRKFPSRSGKLTSGRYDRNA